MKQIEEEITSTLTHEGASFIHFVDVRGLPTKQTKGLPNAIFFGLALTPSYLHKVMETTDYVETIVAQNQVDHDEFSLKELKAGELSDRIAEMLVLKGYRAYSLSDHNLLATCDWDEKNLKTSLPQKTIAILAGTGWIGKNNLLITPEYGPALCVGTILTDAPLHTPPSQAKENRCGACDKCSRVCPTNALYGTTWTKNTTRERIIDVHKCTTCMKCLVYCSYTQKYLKLAKPGSPVLNV